MASDDPKRTLPFDGSANSRPVEGETLPHLPRRGGGSEPHRPALANGISFSRTEAAKASQSRASHLRIHCPRCRRPIEISADGELTSLVCTTCHAKFDVAGEGDESLRAESVATIAHFELIERVGMGGFGTVWKARDTQLDRVVALKIPRKGALAHESLDEFLHEARIAAQLTHPNIARVFQVGRDGDVIYLISQFMEGKSLDVWRREANCSQRDLIELCAKICRALDFAHEAGVVHRDLKPQNILMDERGEPHVTDFGLAMRSVGQVTMTSDGRILGTPAYISPEQAAGDAALADRRSDVYSFGVLLFELLTDALPFRGTVEVLIHKAIEEEPPRPSSLNAAIPPDLETICLKCLDKRPRNRYETAAEVADELDRFLRGEPILARPIGNVERAWRWCRRHPVFPVLFGALLAVIVLVHVVGWFWFDHAYRKTDAALTARSVTGVGFAADSVAHTAQRQLEASFTQLETLASRDRLRRDLAKLQADAALREVLARLDDSRLSEPDRDELRAKLRAHPAQQSLQETLRQAAAVNPTAFGWFILGRDGLQLARWPANETIGVNYAWRSYYHGGSVDFADLEEYLRSDRPRIQGTHLSAAFVSQISDRWVVAISTPIWAPANSRDTSPDASPNTTRDGNRDRDVDGDSDRNRDLNRDRDQRVGPDTSEDGNPNASRDSNRGRSSTATETAATGTAATGTAATGAAATGKAVTGTAATGTDVPGAGAAAAEGEFLGVVALLYELGQITELPGEESEQVFAGLIDTRVSREGTILQHPLYERLLAERDQRLPDRLQTYRVSLDGWQPTPHPRVYTHIDYHDPLGDDELGSEFRQRWLAARSPVTVRGSETGLWAVVQQSYEQAIGGELERLRQKIHALAVATGVLVVALILPAWALVLRGFR